jgi:hypothetical protein
MELAAGLRPDADFLGFERGGEGREEVGKLGHGRIPPGIAASLLGVRRAGRCSSIDDE